MFKLFKIFFGNKKIIPIFLGAVIIFSLTPSSFAQAGVWEDIAKSLSLVPDVLMSIPLWLLFGPVLMGAFICSMIVPLIGYAYLAISAGLLNWVTSDYFVSMPLTRGGIVDIGLSKTTALVNIVFVLVLVFIALSTILRLENYGMKKLLPKFLLVVILINFASVICGVVIDIAKVVTNTFLQPDLGTIFLKVYLTNTPIGTLITNIQNVTLSIASGADLATNLEKIIRILTPFFTLSGIVGTVLQALVATLFLFFAATEIMLFVLLFMMRIIAIWLLVILAPIAWLCWILPDFKNVYQTWEKYFIQWAFVGAIAGFFLWLQTQLAGKLGEIFNCACVGNSCTGSSCIQITDTWVGIFTSPFINVINQLFIFGTVIGISLIGFIIAIKTGSGTGTGPPGGQTIIKRLGDGIGTVARRRVAGPATRKAAEGISKAANWGERMADSSKFTWGGKKHTTPWAAAAKWTTKGAETLFAPGLTEYAAKQRKVATPDGWKQMSIPEQMAYVNSQDIDTDKLTLASTMKDDGAFQKTGGLPGGSEFQKNIFDLADKYKSDLRYKKESGDIFDALPEKLTKDNIIGFKLAGKTESKRADEEKEIIKEINGISTEYNITEKDAASLYHIKGMKPKDVTGVGNKKSLPFRLALRKMGSTHLKQLKDSSSENDLKEILDGPQGLNTLEETNLKAIHNQNPALIKWAFNNPAGKEMLNWSSKFPKFVPGSSSLTAEEAMVEEVNEITKKIGALNKKTLRTKAEEEEIKMSQAAINDIKKRLKNLP